MYKQMMMWLEDYRFSKVENAVNLGKRVPFIKQILPKNSIGAELGVFKGQFSEILMRHLDVRELHLIDPWYFLASYWHWGGGNRSTVDAVVRILKRWKYEIENKRVFVHIGDDRTVLKSFPDAYFDWVYIDSSHEYQHTLDELTLLKHKVKPSGIIAGDDWQTDPSHRHHGVYKAVNEFIASEGYSVIYSSQGTQQWAIKKAT